MTTLTPSYVVKKDLITEKVLLEAISNVENGLLPVHRTPCIEVINKTKGYKTLVFQSKVELGFFSEHCK